MVHSFLYILRLHRPSDMELVVQVHSEVCSEEFGFNKELERMVEGIVVDFAGSYNPKWERCWIAEMDDKPVDCVFLVKKSDTLAQPRSMLVEPIARGLGIGRRSVEE